MTVEKRKKGKDLIENLTIFFTTIFKRSNIREGVNSGVPGMSITCLPTSLPEAPLFTFD
jgi:hypothetical protein